MSLLKNQLEVSPQRGMPTDDVGNSSKIVAVTGETVQLYYSNSGVRTADAGQAAGVAVQGQLAYENIKDSTGTMSGTKLDNSLSFTAGALTTEVALPPGVMETVDGLSFANKLAVLTAGLANGEYVVDYVNGTIWGKKTTTDTTLANAAYKVQSALSTTTLVAGDLEIGAVEIKNSTDDTRATVGANGLYVDVRASALPSGAATETTLGSVKTAVELIDDAVLTDDTTTFTPASTKAVAVGGCVDDASTDSADEGDMVVARFSARRAAMTSLDTLIEGEDQTNHVMGTVTVPLAVTTYCWSVDQSAALEASTVTKASAGVIREFDGRIDSTAASGTYYIQFLNAASLPADGAVTHLRTPVKVIHTTGADSLVNVDFLEQGLYASTGIVVCLSTSEFVKAIGGNYLSSTVRYA